MGRRKIEIKIVKDSGCRQVTFSKRRTGLFKKANELATLCGAEVAVVVFSPGGKPFSFGQPTVESIADRYLSETYIPGRRFRLRRSKKLKKDSEASPEAAARLTEQLNEVTKALDDEKQRGEAMDEETKAAGGEIDVDALGFGGLKALKKSLEVLRERAKERAGQMEASSTLLMLSNGVNSA